jgi:hypothetical protein
VKAFLFETFYRLRKKRLKINTKTCEIKIHKKNKIKSEKLPKKIKKSRKTFKFI